jgi:hypothetical protein|tara:strand:+ start:3988 stop:5403 length:1416 start_codon:yes stop_codon:yes gene_type:complete
MANDNTINAPIAGSLVTPAYKKMTTLGSYLDIQNDGWAKQYLPELYEQEVTRYGDRTISGFIQMMGAEMPMASDQVIWSEQGRLHLAYQGTVATSSGLVTAIKNIDQPGQAEVHAVRKGATVVCVVSNVVFKGFVTEGIEASDTQLKIKPYAGTNMDNLSGIADTSTTIKFFVYGSEFGKGTDKMEGSIEPQFKTFTNNPLIIKDHFEINGSDTAQIGWIEVSGESGNSGYLWYLKSEGDTRARFNDYLEMVMVEAEKAASDASAGVPAGSEGLLAAIGSRGMVATNQFNDSTGGLGEFDEILTELDKQGAIEENMLFLDRGANLIFDDMLAGISAGSAGGTAYGVFENSEDMALNLGFRGFRRGSYDFYKTDWKYLNNPSTRGLVGGLKGLLVPAGTTSVYDQGLGNAVRRPFLHVRYRASQADDRKLKTWVTGSVGGGTSSGFDKMEVHYLSERCLVVQAANNFIRFDS